MSFTVILDQYILQETPRKQKITELFFVYFNTFKPIIQVKSKAKKKLTILDNFFSCIISLASSAANVDSTIMFS